MRFALVSDLHANTVAFDAVLADARQSGVDAVCCLGDVATLGPDPDGMFDRVAELDGPRILGNHDAFLLDAELIRTYSEAPVVVDSVEWARDRLRPEQAALIRTFAAHATLELGHGATLFLFHGTPRSHMEELLATTPPEAVEEMLAGSSGTVMAGGHTHVQMLRQHRGTLLVNPGSVGMPFLEHVSGRAPTVLPYAEYAVVTSRAEGVSVELRRVALDRRALRAAALASDVPIGPSLAAQYA